METGRKILNLRKDLGVPQKTLAQLTAVTPSALSRIEAGIHQPRGPVALRIARRLGVTVDYLLDENAPYPPPARELLANLTTTCSGAEKSTSSMLVSGREKALLAAFRQLDLDRRVLLEAVFNASRTQTRFAAYLLGAAEQLPGIDPDELSEFEIRRRG